MGAAEVLATRFPDPGQILQVIEFILWLYPPETSDLPPQDRLWLLMQWAHAVGATIMPYHKPMVKHGVPGPE